MPKTKPTHGIEGAQANTSVNWSAPRPAMPQRPRDAAHGRTAATMVYRPEVPLTADDGPPEEVVRERITLTVDGRTIPVTTGRFVVGRSRECDVRVDDGNVSRRHFELVQEGPTTWVVADLGSTNGTEVNGQRVSGRKRLDDGDRITIGGTELVFGRSLR
ncbi:MAG TPA: FHA domain-containing protein [Gaiella sp.]|nr:FHA domain-containing protein [Gaiella sp.]